MQGALTEKEVEFHAEWEGRGEVGDPDLSRSTDKANTSCLSNHSTVCVCLHFYIKTKGLVCFIVEQLHTR